MLSHTPHERHSDQGGGDHQTVPTAASRPTLTVDRVPLGDEATPERASNDRASVTTSDAVAPHPTSAGLLGVAPSFEQQRGGSPIPVASAGIRSPTNFTNNVSASVVRNALPQESTGSSNLYASVTQRMASSMIGADLSSIGSPAEVEALRASPPATHAGSSTGAFAGHGDATSAASSTRGAAEGMWSPPQSGSMVPPGSFSTAGHATASFDPHTVSPDTSPFSRERAEQNFAKVRDLARELMKSRCARGKAEGSGAGAGACDGADSGGAATEAQTPPSPAVDADVGDGGKLYDVIRAAKKEADAIDSAEGGATHTGPTTDWREDDNVVQSPSAFFRSPASLETTSNRVMETIIAKGHAAATDDELRWLYRHANLLNLLDKPELDRVVSVSLRREYMNGETIASQHSNIRHLHVVLWGDVEVFRATSQSQEQEALASAFCVTASPSPSLSPEQKQQQQQQQPPQPHQHQGSRSASVAVDRMPFTGGAPVRTSPHDLMEIQSSRRSRSRSALGSALMQHAAEEREADDGDVVYTHVATLLPGQVFGTESFVFDQTNQFVFRAGGSTKKTVVSLVPFAALEPSLETNPRFAQGVGGAIAGSVDVFNPIRQFCRYVFSSRTSQNDYLPLWSIVSAYTQINNVIHTKLFRTELDTGAWGYALNRLPENVTSTFCFDLVHALPPFVASRMRVEAHAADVRKAPSTASADVGRARTAVAFIRTKERRRCTWHLGMEGKDLVLLRDGFTDLMDFLTMLCVHIIESNKLRGRVQGMVHPPAIDILDNYLRAREEERSQQRVIPVEEEMARIKGILARMPLTTEEQSGLLRNWGAETLLKIYEVMMHREEFNVRVDPSVARQFQINPFHEWALNLRGCVLEKLGLDRSHALPDDLCIDVVSSNTHCIKNLLCSFNRKYRQEILAYATKKEGKKLGKPSEWHTLDDMIYVATSGFLRDERPDLKDEFQQSLEDNGITVLHDTAMTGLQVDVIPVHYLNFDMVDETIRQSLRESFNAAMQEAPGDGESGQSFRTAPTWAQMCQPLHGPHCAAPHACPHQHPRPRQRSSFSARASPPPGTDTATAEGATTCASPTPTSSSSPSSPRASRGPRLRRHFIINMDFAFGAQAEGICRAVFSAFGKRIRSVSVMGKAGGMRGKRGDIQLASHVLLSKSSLILEDNQDELRSCRNQDFTPERLQELAGPRVAVHHGKVLTVTGTMLQNVALLRYYKNVWRCVGTEMEGSYFARVIEDFYRQGIANANLQTRFAYYTSDLPLAQSEAEEDAKAGRRHAGASATLSAPMTPLEGVPPLYAIARGILEKILLS